MVSKQGYLYAICKQGDLSTVKIGHTRSLDPHAYVGKYNRTMFPVQTLHLLPASDSKLLETMSLHFLKADRKNTRNELFDLSYEGGSDRLAECMNAVTRFDLATGQPRPEVPTCPNPKPRARKRKASSVPGSEDSTPHKPSARKVRRRVKARLSEEELEAVIEAQEREKKQRREEDVQRARQTLEREVKKFVDATVCEGDRSDFVRIGDLVTSFNANRTTRATVPRRLLENLFSTCLDRKHLKAVHNYTADRRKQKARSVCIGHRMIEVVLL